MPEKFYNPESDPKLDAEALKALEALRVGDIAGYLAWDAAVEKTFKDINLSEGGLAAVHATAKHSLVKAQICLEAGRIGDAYGNAEAVILIGGNDIAGSETFQQAMAILYKIEPMIDTEGTKTAE